MNPISPTIAAALQKGVPGVPIAALDSIEDANVRQVLRAVVDGWHVRNGTRGDGTSRFVTASELGDLSGQVGGLRQSVAALQQARPERLTSAEISRIITDLQASVIESVLFNELGDRIRLIDVSVLAEQQARIAAVQAVADDLAAEAAARLGFDQVSGSQIASLQSTSATQATQISGLTTRVGGAESTIVSLQQTTASQATSLTSLTTRVGTAESSITSLNTTTASQAQALSSLSTRVGSAESNISTLNTTTSNQANSLTALTTRVGNAESAITNEATTRANEDNAISSYVTTQLASVNGTLAGFQSQQTATANNVAALSSDLTTLQATVDDNTAAIESEATTRVNADNEIYAKYSVKIDVNGYVTGFGLISTANNSTPFSEFMVRADRFSIASPSGPGISPVVPFIVTTTPTARPDGTTLPAGVYMDTAMVKTLSGAYIYAGLLEAARVYSGSTLVDRDSNYEMLTTANGNWMPGTVDTRIATGSHYEEVWSYLGEGGEGPIYGWVNTLVTDYGYFPVTASALRFYSSSLHYATTKKQRVRNTNNGQSIPFFITASATVDHYFSIWYRRNGGSWTFISKVVEPQDDYGSASLSAVIELPMAAGDYVDFGVGACNEYFSPWNGGKAELRDLTMSVMAVNI